MTLMISQFAKFPKTIYSFQNSNNQKYNKSNRYLYNNNNNDTISINFKGKTFTNMVKYYNYKNIDYTPQSDEEKEFASKLQCYVAEQQGGETLRAKSIDFNQAYDNVMDYISETENMDALKYVFCSLIENLDKTKNDQIAKNLYLCTYEELLPAYSKQNEMQEVLQTYVNTELLSKPILKVTLKKFLV